jgi:REP element-mobilizing transposase RayT
MPWGIEALLRHGKPPFHHLELLSTQAATRQSRAPRPGTNCSRADGLRYRFAVIGYVVMREHVHLLISEPLISESMIGDPSKIIQAVKLSVSRRLAMGGKFSGRFWQSRFYDFNLWGQQKEIEKLKYMHRNPVVRGLATSPEEWRWSSYRSYAYGETGLVRINDWTWWEEKIRQSAG